MPNIQSFKIVCPYCYKENQHNSDLDINYQNIACSNCNKNFNTRIVKSRSRNSRHVKISKKEDFFKLEERQFSIRIKDFQGNEDIIEFGNWGRDNFEFRSGDIVGFTYLQNNKLKVVQNFTINRHMRVRPAPTWINFIINLIFAIPIIFLIIIILLVCGRTQ